MSLLYLTILVVVVSAFTAMDARWRLVFFVPGARSRIAAGATIAIGVTLFLLWDAAGIAFGIFFRGENDLMTGVLIAPELPVEEVVFLALLGYQTLFFTAVARRLLGRPGRRS